MKKTWSVIVLAAALVSLSGCVVGSIGRMASTQKTFTQTDSVAVAPQQTNASAALDVVAQVGTQFGYEVTGIDRVSNRITLTSRNSQFARVMVGHSRQATIIAQLRSSQVIFTYIASGNFSDNKAENADSSFQAFKAEVAKRLGTPTLAGVQ